MRSWSAFSLLVFGLLLGTGAWFGTRFLGSTVVAPEYHDVFLAGIGLVILAWIMAGYVILIFFEVAFRGLSIRTMGALVICVGMVGVGISLLYLNHRFALAGRSTQAVVVGRLDTTVHQKVDGLPVGTRHEYSVDYTYQVAGVNYSKQKVPVSQEIWSAAETNRYLPISYLADEPGVDRIEAGNERGGDNVIPWGLMGIGALGFFGCVNKLQHQAAAVRRPASAVRPLVRNPRFPAR